jgi:adenylosuccinate synthase
MAGPHAEQYLQTSLNHHLLQLEVLKYPVPEDFNQQIQVWKDALQQLLERFPPVDGTELLQQALKQNQKVLAEGAQGSMLDVEFGSYPYVTSSHTTAAAACTGLGLAPNQIGEVYGLFKAYCTRVGSGPFPTELHDATGDALRAAGNEFGATTGRPRRCGWLDLPALNYAIRLSGVTKLILTKADVLSGFPTVRVAIDHSTKDADDSGKPNSSTKISYKEFNGWTLEKNKAYRHISELPCELQDFLVYIENTLNVPITIISLGPERTQTITM